MLKLVNAVVKRDSHIVVDSMLLLEIDEKCKLNFHKLFNDITNHIIDVNDLDLNDDNDKELIETIEPFVYEMNISFINEYEIKNTLFPEVLTYKILGIPYCEMI